MEKKTVRGAKNKLKAKVKTGSKQRDNKAPPRTLTAQKHEVGDSCSGAAEGFFCSPSD